MMIKMDELNAGQEMDPFSRLENLVQKAKARKDAPEGTQTPRTQETQANASQAELDFNDPRVRENFLGSLRTQEGQDSGTQTYHALDPQRVAALLDLE